MNRTPRYVLDTHAALWTQLAPARLSRAARAALTGLPPACVAISDITLTETARLLCERRVVPHAVAPDAWLDAFGGCFALLPVTPRIAWTAAAFAWPHRDPCDRHILAAAMVHDLPLLTIDPEITAFAPSVGVKIVW